MLQYPSSAHQSYPALKEIIASTKVKKPRKCSLRSTRKHLKQEFEKLFVPAFARKLQKHQSVKASNSSGFQAKKPNKILPDNLADFIVDNEAAQQMISEDDYMKCMEILTKTGNRKLQVLQICQLLGEFCLLLLYQTAKILFKLLFCKIYNT